MSGRIFERVSAKWLSGFYITLIVIAFLSLSAAAYAADITYKGDGKNLQNGPTWLYSIEGLSLFLDSEGLSLFPGSEKAPLTSDNKVTLNYSPKSAGVQHPEFVCGGMSEVDNVVNNKVILLNGRIDKRMSAGNSVNGDSIGNKVSISGGSVGWGVSGGRSLRGNAVDNKVTINGGSVSGGISGGDSLRGNAIGNKVTMNGGSVSGAISGGFSEKGDVAGNNVTIRGGSVGWGVSGGYSPDSDATGNIVTISGGSVGEGVYGGASLRGSAMNNTVTISGGSVGEAVYGGSVGADVYGSGNGNATSNTVTISGKPDLTKTSISGGYKEVASGDVFTGNTLNLKSSGISAKSISNFEYYNFYLPENLAADGTMLSVTETVNLQKTTVKVSPQGGSKLRKGDKISLIKSAKGVSNAPKNKSCQVKQGGTLYEFSIYTDSNNLWAKVTKISRAAK